MLSSDFLLQPENFLSAVSLSKPCEAVFCTRNGFIVITVVDQLTYQLSETAGTWNHQAVQLVQGEAT